MTIYARALALLILAGWAGEYVVDALNGSWSVKYTLPLQLTRRRLVGRDRRTLDSARQLAVELVYFWSLTASLQADAHAGPRARFPSIYYFTCFSYHIGALTAACCSSSVAAIVPAARARPGGCSCARSRARLSRLSAMF